MMTTAHARQGRAFLPDVAQFQLETLDSLACGCVVAIQRLRPSGVAVVSLEAKGPHCTYQQHRANKVIRLGDPLEDADYDETAGAPA